MEEQAAPEQAGRQRNVKTDGRREQKSLPPVFRISYLYPAEAKSADAVLPNAAAGASAPTKSADAVLPNAAAGASAPMLQFESSASAGLSNFYTGRMQAPGRDAAHPISWNPRIRRQFTICSLKNRRYSRL